MPATLESKPEATTERDYRLVGSFALADERMDAPGAEKKGDGSVRMSGVAYAGNAVRRWWGMAIWDVDGIEIPEAGAKKPLLLNHGFAGGENPRLGYVEKVEKDGAKLNIAGVLTNSNDSSAAVIKDAKAGFPFELSIYAEPLTIEEVEPGVSVEVNGQTMAGPLTVIRKSRLREISLVEIGADFGTSTEFTLTHRGHPMSTAAKTVAITEITKDWLLANLPEVAKSLATAPPGPAPTPAAAGPASFDQLSALAGDDAPFIVAAQKDGLTLDAARERLTSSLREQLGEKGKLINELQEKLETALKAQGAAPVGPGKPDQPAPKQGQYAGCLGNNPEQDWSLSESLRKDWEGDGGGKAAFLSYARAQQAAGLSWITPPTW